MSNGNSDRKEVSLATMVVDVVTDPAELDEPSVEFSSPLILSNTDRQFTQPFRVHHPERAKALIASLKEYFDTVFGATSRVRAGKEGLSYLDVRFPANSSASSFVRQLRYRDSSMSSLLARASS